MYVIKIIHISYILTKEHTEFIRYVKYHSSLVFFFITYKMATKQMNIKNRTYYYYNDLINITNFEASNLKLDNKTSLGLHIYYIGYVDRKPEWNVNSVNPLYLIINRIDVFAEDKSNSKYLNISDTGRNSEMLKNKIKYLMELNIIPKKWHIFSTSSFR